jgi:hypothetical protein
VPRDCRPWASLSCCRCFSHKLCCAGNCATNNLHLTSLKHSTSKAARDPNLPTTGHLINTPTYKTGLSCSIACTGCSAPQHRQFSSQQCSRALTDSCPTAQSCDDTKSPTTGLGPFLGVAPALSSLALSWVFAWLRFRARILDGPATRPTAGPPPRPLLPLCRRSRQGQ